MSKRSFSSKADWESFADLMSLTFHVKTRLLLAAVLLPAAACADDVPDAKEILKAVRLAQTEQNPHRDRRVAHRVEEGTV